MSAAAFSGLPAEAPRIMKETGALFCAKRYEAANPAAARFICGTLCRSMNAAVANEARRMFAVMERRRLGDGGDCA